MYNPQKLRDKRQLWCPTCHKTVVAKLGLCPVCAAAGLKPRAAGKPMGGWGGDKVARPKQH